MVDTDTLQQLQNRIVEMERCHEEELRKLKANHNQLEARIRKPRVKTTLLTLCMSTPKGNHTPNA